MYAIHKHHSLPLTVAMMLMLLLTICAVCSPARASGDGTMGNPWQITSVTELQELAESVNSGNARAGEYFLLTADLDLSGVCGANLNGQEVGWTPIGCAGDITFCGVFDGAGHTVSNLYICEGENYRGLFGTVSGTVKNLNVTGNVLASATFDSYIGGVAGASYGAVESCTFSGKVSGRNYVGGVVGICNGALNYCVNSGAVTGETKSAV